MEMKNNNKGFSLVELIVTVLIIGVMAGSSILLYNIVQRRNYIKCSDNTADALEIARQSAMVREEGSDVGVIFYFYERNYHAQVVFFNSDNTITLKGEYNLGGGSLSFSKCINGSTTKTTMTKKSIVPASLSNLTYVKSEMAANDIFVVLFNKTNGSIKSSGRTGGIGNVGAFDYLQISRGGETLGDYSNVLFSKAGRPYVEYH